MTHAELRLIDRNISLTPSAIMGFVYEYGDMADSIALIVNKVDFQGASSGSYRSRSESNGDLVVLIIRDRKPITVMYRRSNQNNTVEGLKVHALIDLTK